VAAGERRLAVLRSRLRDFLIDLGDRDPPLSTLAADALVALAADSHGEPDRIGAAVRTVDLFLRRMLPTYSAEKVATYASLKPLLEANPLDR